MDLVSKTSRKASMESANAIESNIDSVLVELIDQLPGVSAAMLFDTDGFALSGVIRPGGTLEPEAAEAAAMGASLIGAARRALAAGAGSQADAPVRSIWVRNDRQNLYCVEVGEAAYAVVTAEPEVPAGLLMFRIDKWSKLAAQAIESLSLTIPEQPAGSDLSRAERNLLAVEVPADRIGPVRVGVPDDIADSDADRIEPFEPYVADEDAAAGDRGALYAHGGGLVAEDLALDGESFDLAEAIGIELVAEAETEAEAELLAAEPTHMAESAPPAEPMESAWAPPDLPTPPDLPAPADLPTPSALPQEWSVPAPVAPEPVPAPVAAVQPKAAEAPVAAVFAASNGLEQAPPVAPQLSDDWVIMETAAAPAAPAGPTPMALADAMGDWLAPSAPVAPNPVPTTHSSFPALSQARAPQGSPVSFAAPPPGFAPVPPAWMAPAPVAARAPMVAPSSQAPRPTAPAPAGRPVSFGAPPPIMVAPPPIMVAPPPMAAPVSFDPPPRVYGGQPAVNPNSYRPMAPRPATAVWSPSAPDDAELDRADIPSWGAYGNPNPNQNATRP